MKKSMRGFGSVFSFTCSQIMRKKGYIVLTVLLAILLIVGVGAAVILTGAPDEEEKPSEIKKVFVLNETELPMPDFAKTLEEDPYYAEIEFAVLEGMTQEQAFAKAQEELKEMALVAVVEKKDDGYTVTMIIGDDGDVSEYDTEELAWAMAPAVQDAVYEDAGLSESQVGILNMQVTVDCVEIGEDTSFIAFLIKMLAPMVFGMVMYFILLAYGQMASKEVAIEKTSKLMESMLTMVQPNALIAGKVLAVTVAVLVQAGIWLLSLVIGLVGGSYIAEMIYPEYTNVIPIILDFLRANIGESALTPTSIVLAIVLFMLGVLFYLVIAGMSGSIVTKPEDTANAQSLFVLPVLVSWLVGYFACMMENEKALRICRYIPFTAPFTAPVELMTGQATTLEGLFSCLIVLAGAALVIWIAARLYKGLILYNGQKLSFKTVWGVLRGK